MNILLSLILAVVTGPAHNLQVTSSAFGSDSKIPSKYTCDGENVNPPLTIKNIPPKARSLAIIVDDPDAPSGTFDHWVIWDIDPREKISEDSAPGSVGKNGRGNNAYTGPCPPSGTHHYHFKVYALDKKLELQGDVDSKTLVDKMQGHILASGELVGLYEKTKQEVESSSDKR